MEQKKDKQEAREQLEKEIPIVSEIHCLECGSSLLSIIGFLCTRDLLIQCTNCGRLNCLSGLTGEKIRLVKHKKTNPSYLQ